MIDRDIMRWIVGIGLSLILHAALLIQTGAQLGVENASEGKVPMITRLNFYQQRSTQIESLQKPSLIDPIIKKIKTAAKSVNEKILDEPRQVEVDEPLAHVQAQSQGQLSDNKSALLISKKKEYMQELLAHIENYKFYPRSARSRGIEGDIQVFFELMADGNIRALKVTRGRSVLQRATQQAVQNAIPLPVPPLELSMPQKIEFTIQYRLQ